MWLARRSIVALAGLAVCAFCARAEVGKRGAAWTLSNARLEVTFDGQSGAWSVLDKGARATWRSPAGGGARWTSVRPVAGPAEGLRLERPLPMAGKGGEGAAPVLIVTVRLVPDAAELLVEADTPDRSAAMAGFAPLEPLLAPGPGFDLAMADYSNGHLYPLETKPFPRGSMTTSRMDMPWFGVTSVARGLGYMVIVATSDDGTYRSRAVKVDGRETVGPEIAFLPCKKQFGYARRLLYHFSARGSYVALAKRYREYARGQGLIVPFAQKLKKNPNIERLFGAPDVWGNPSLKFAQEAKAAGVEKMLIHGRSKPEEMQAINALGYLTSEYDNYTDVLPIEPGKELGSNRDRIPESVVLKADGERMEAWLTFDKKQQYMKRCPGLWVRTAKHVVPEVLAKQPFLGRFIDVTTAEDLYECYDPAHPLTRGQKRQCGVDLLGYVRSLGLVMGGEHGVWWSVPDLDYIEGMMSASYYPWPAGHLIRPKTKEDEFNSPRGHKLPKWEVYETWGIGHEYRVPLWELVFHDCVVSTWYWGDASDFLLMAAPEITPKKDAYNVLYGTIPLLWANKQGSWTTDREVFLRTYRNTCKLHEQVAGTEMVSHEYLTADRAVQRTHFSDGTVTIVNFGAEPQSVELAGRSYRLPQNGFAVKGPKIEQSLELKDGRPVTSIRTKTYRFAE